MPQNSFTQWSSRSSIASTRVSAWPTGTGPLEPFDRQRKLPMPRLKRGQSTRVIVKISQIASPLDSLWVEDDLCASLPIDGPSRNVSGPAVTTWLENVFAKRSIAEVFFEKLSWRNRNPNESRERNWIAERMMDQRHDSRKVINSCNVTCNLKKRKDFRGGVVTIKKQSRGIFEPSNVNLNLTNDGLEIPFQGLDKSLQKLESWNVSFFFFSFWYSASRWILELMMDRKYMF